MKDIQYFLSEEEKYLASSQAEPELVWNEELEEFGFSYERVFVVDYQQYKKISVQK